MSSYKIIRRSVTKPHDHISYCDFDNRNYTIPLAGCSNYDQQIHINNIIGVILESIEYEHPIFKHSSNIVSNSYLKSLVLKTGHFRRKEEHLFKIRKIIGNKYFVDPVFIDGKVISKRIEESFNITVDVPTDKIDQMELCIEYLDKHKSQISYKYISDFSIRNKITKFKESLDKFDFLISDVDKPNVRVYLDKLEILDRVEKDTAKVYADALTFFGHSYKTQINYSYHEPVHLHTSKITHQINKIKFQDIHRVYAPDNIYYLAQTEHLTNWSGILIDESIRTQLVNGNVCRICIKKKNSDSSYTFIVYCTILKKLGEYKYLAQLESFYMSKYEDIVIVIDSRAISEIPTDWTENENLLDYHKSIGRGYHTTGMGSLSNLSNTYEINYDGLSF